MGSMVLAYLVFKETEKVFPKVVTAKFLNSSVSSIRRDKTVKIAKKKKKSPQMPVTVVLKVGPPNQKYLYHLRICQKNADLRGHTRFLHLCFSKPPRCLRMLILEFVNH